MQKKTSNFLLTFSFRFFKNKKQVNIVQKKRHVFSWIKNKKNFYYYDSNVLKSERR